MKLCGWQIQKFSNVVVIDTHLVNIFYNWYIRPSITALPLIIIFNVCIFYNPGGSKKSVSGNNLQIPESISASCDLLRCILSQQLQPSLAKFIQHSSDSYRVSKMRQRILDECHRTFVRCFHAFYPTAQLKWLFLCDLLTPLDQVCAHCSCIGAVMVYYIVL